MEVKMNHQEDIASLLEIIEQRCQEKLNLNILSDSIFLSSSHLQKKFKLLTRQSLMDYTRGRKLAYSLEDLFNTNLRIIDIAHEYGFAHEQSYVRAFQMEYGCSPGKVRKCKKILPIRERISVKDLGTSNRGLLHGPVLVMMPSFHLVGIPHVFQCFDGERDALIPNQLGHNFYYSYSNQIANRTCHDVYYGIVTMLSERNGHIEYHPSVQVKDLSKIPAGMVGRTISPHLYVHFRYVGEHHYDEINMITAKNTYDEIAFYLENETRYIQEEPFFFERIDAKLYDGKFCQMEWYIPVTDTIK